MPSSGGVTAGDGDCDGVGGFGEVDGVLGCDTPCGYVVWGVVGCCGVSGFDTAGSGGDGDVGDDGEVGEVGEAGEVGEVGESFVGDVDCSPFGSWIFFLASSF